MQQYVRRVMYFLVLTLSISLFTACPDTPGVPSDTISPGEISVTAITAGATNIAITWTDPSDDDFDHVLLTWNPDGTTGTEVASGTNTYDIIGLTNTTQYSILLQTVDNAGNESTGERFILVCEVQDVNLITSAAELNAIKDDPANNYGDTYFLMTDIDLSGYSAGAGWVGIGDGIDGFTGRFDGKGHVVSNLTIDDANGFAGLFGSLLDGTIRDLGVEAASVICAGNYTGILLGINNGGTVEYCYSSGTVTGTATYTGGLIGYHSNYSEMSNCYSTATVNGADRNGGLVGQNGYSTIEYCYATGDVTGSGDHNGGLIGYNGIFSTVSNSYATGDVTGTGDYAGGLAGIHSTSTLTDCFATGDVDGANYVGGLTGQNVTNEITNCYSIGVVTATGLNVGGHVGHNNGGTITDSFYNSDTTTQSDTTKGTPKTTAELISVNTFTDTATAGLSTAWDFVNDPNDDAATDDYWAISAGSNGGYPFLTDLDL